MPDQLEVITRLLGLILRNIDEVFLKKRNYNRIFQNQNSKIVSNMNLKVLSGSSS